MLVLNYLPRNVKFFESIKSTEHSLGYPNQSWSTLTQQARNSPLASR
jgi:hypothetical protein